MKHLFLLVFYMYFLFINSFVLATPVPHLINYQGKLVGLDGNPLPNGQYSLTFNIYDDISGGTLLWGPQQFSNVPVSDGYFNVILGASGSNINTAFSGDSAYLEISVNGSAILPRQQVMSTPYAIEAEHAESASLVKKRDLTTEFDGFKEGVISTPKEIELYDCHVTDYLNCMDCLLDAVCPEGEVLNGLYSYHSNGTEDRQWKFKCCKLRVNIDNFSDAQ